MNFKKSPSVVQDKNKKDIENPIEYPTIADLMRDQKVSNESITVHFRRDLDSLG